MKAGFITSLDIKYRFLTKTCSSRNEKTLVGISFSLCCLKPYSKLHFSFNPVDKNRSTTGGQSGLPYLELWPQQEDSPDHANWEYIIWKASSLQLWLKQEDSLDHANWEGLTGEAKSANQGFYGHGTPGATQPEKNIPLLGRQRGKPYPYWHWNVPKRDPRRPSVCILQPMGVAPPPRAWNTT